MNVTAIFTKLALQQKDMRMNWKNAKGFTLVEMILTVAVMAILVGMTTPAIFEFIRQRDKQSEETTQLQVRKALEAYIADKGSAPKDSGTPLWYNALAGYTSLSPNEIANDVWGRPRMYLAYNDTTRQIYGTTVSVSYVTLHSMGENGEAAKSAGVAVKGTAFDGSTVSGWWRNMGNIPTAFSAVTAAGDDQMMRYTNYEDVLQRYNATRERMEKVGEALETYARNEYANHVKICAPNTSKTHATCNEDGTPKLAVYYPKSTSREAAGDTALYVLAGKVNPTVTVSNATTAKDSARRANMETLMTLLGLPLEYCCSALDVSTQDSKPAPFFYFSNPRPRQASGCGARPTVAQSKLPARITTQYYLSTDAKRTCG